MFISDTGLLKEDELGSGLKASTTCSPAVPWSNNIKVTFCLKGHVRRASYWLRMMTKKSETYFPFPILSPFKYILNDECKKLLINHEVINQHPSFDHKTVGKQTWHTSCSQNVTYRNKGNICWSACRSLHLAFS